LLLHLIRKIIRIIAAAVVIASKEKVSILCVKRIFSIWEYICEVGVTIKTTYDGDFSPLIEIGYPVVSLSPKPMV
jgi:hypothetical protein